MTHTIPIELAQSRRAANEAWENYQALCDREHTTAEWIAALQTAEAREQTARSWYDRWQNLGGTSDIHSICETERKNQIIE